MNVLPSYLIVNNSLKTTQDESKILYKRSEEYKLCKRYAGLAESTKYI